MAKDKVIIVIPAKGTSRRLPGKNLMKLGGMFGGKSLVEIAVERSIGSGLGKVVVSTDSTDIGMAVLGFMDSRPVEGVQDVSKMPYVILLDRYRKELCQDNARAWEVCIDAMERTDGCDTLVMTLPTSPFCTSTHIKQAYDMFLNGGRRPVLSVRKVEFNPETLCDKKGTKKDKDQLYPYDTANMFWDFGVVQPSKDVFISNGAVWVVDVDELIREREQYIKGMVGYEMDEVASINIDTRLDYITACAIASDFDWKVL